ncbi:BglG family transcription antiterminator [Halobacillus yeomjeoni]|uniref:BglG family transcription antiterminator n=1 Tax=Halobacillus yeomjeoni TaxID=311194 RepID=A0A931HXF6_9BACI|nr:PRD domain-containing protein [Halobacillus yeomjeoni]MBH0231189.1 BglG family transcription antiterminator [Halobacillus yeomjeoni]
MYVSARERKLIEMLLSVNHEVPIQDLADELDVSSRTVRRDLKGMGKILNHYGLALEKVSGKGIAILGDESEKLKLKSSIYEQKALDYTPEERSVLILSRLLDSREPVKLLTLANELGVTVATISLDLDKIEEILTEYELSLVRKRGYGVEVKGEEANIRGVLHYVIMNHLKEQDFLKFIRENMETHSFSDKTVDSISDHLLGLVDKEKVWKIEPTVDSLLSTLTYPLADHAYIGLIIHLALAIERLQKGEFIQIENEYLDELREKKEFQVAHQLIHRLEAQFDLTIPEAETGYVTMHLMGAKVRYNQEFVLEDSSLNVAFKAKKLIQYVSTSLSKDLNQSNQLLNDLVVHLKPSLYRIQQRMDIQNPLKDQIEEDYAELFSILEDAVKQVFPSLKFPKEETAFLVMHFASALLNMEGTRGLRALVVCSSGIGTAKILAAKLKNYFHEIEKVEHESLFDLHSIDLEHFDLIVSTVPLEGMEEYVLVNPMLPTADVHRLQHLIRKIKILESMHTPGPNEQHQGQTLDTIQESVDRFQKYAAIISQLLNGLNVHRTSLKDTGAILREACFELYQDGVVESADQVQEALMNRLQSGGVGVPNTQIALHHTRHESVNHPVFNIVILQNPVSLSGMDGEEVEASVFLIMLAPRKVQQETLEILGALSSLLIEDEESAYVYQSQDEERIKNYTSIQFHQFLKSKL